MEKLNEYVEAQKFLETLDWDNIPNSGEPLATICEALQDIQNYKDLEKQGLLLWLPCEKGDIVYDVVFCNDEKYHIFKMMVCAINPFGQERKGKVWNVYLECVDDCSKAYRSFYDFGKTVFFTPEEAEQKLKEMNGNHGITE